MVCFNYCICMFDFFFFCLYELGFIPVASLEQNKGVHCISSFIRVKISFSAVPNIESFLILSMVYIHF